MENAPSTTQEAGYILNHLLMCEMRKGGLKCVAIYHRHMIPVSLVALLITACATPPPVARPQHDIALRIKAVAAQHNASMQYIDGQRIYEITAYRVPRGYRTTLTLIEGRRRDAVSASIYENDNGAHRLTVLVDEPLDGRLDYSTTARAHSPNAAWNAIREGRGELSRMTLGDQPLYDQLVSDLRNEVPLTARH